MRTWQHPLITKKLFPLCGSREGQIGTCSDQGESIYVYSPTYPSLFHKEGRLAGISNNFATK